MLRQLGRTQRQQRPGLPLPRDLVGQELLGWADQFLDLRRDRRLAGGQQIPFPAQFGLAQSALDFVPDPAHGETHADFQGARRVAGDQVLSAHRHGRSTKETVKKTAQQARFAAPVRADTDRQPRREGMLKVFMLLEIGQFEVVEHVSSSHRAS